jgi:hypothetical protein
LPTLALPGPTAAAPPPTAVTLPEPKSEVHWYNGKGCPASHPAPLEYPDYGDFYEGIAVCYSGYGDTAQNSVLSNHGEVVWAFNPGSLRTAEWFTDEAHFFRSTFLSDTTQRWYLAPGEVAQPLVWDYTWAPDLHKTSAWTGYKLSADRVKAMDEALHKQVLKRQAPKFASLVSCAVSADGAIKTVGELEDSSSALKKLSAALESTSAGAGCLKAVKDFDDTHPESAKKVPSWTAYTEKVSGASATATKIAAVFDDMFRFCTYVNVPRLGC